MPHPWTRVAAESTGVLLEGCHPWTLFTISRLQLLYHFPIDQSPWSGKTFCLRDRNTGASSLSCIGSRHVQLRTLSTARANFTEKVATPRTNLLFWKLICLLSSSYNALFMKNDSSDGFSGVSRRSELHPALLVITVASGPIGQKQKIF